MGAAARVGRRSASSSGRAAISVIRRRFRPTPRGPNSSRRSTPSAIGTTLLREAGPLWQATQVTAIEILVGFLVAAAVGIALAIFTWPSPS